MAERFYYLSNSILPFSNEDLKIKFERMNAADNNAKDEILWYGIQLVYQFLGTFPKDTFSDQDAVIIIAILKMSESIETYDYCGKLNFKDYCLKYIRNEIMPFTKENTEVSINSKPNFISSCADENKAYEFIRTTLSRIPDLNKEIIKMYFGLNGEEKMTQEQIAVSLKISQTKVSLCLKEGLKSIITALKASPNIWNAEYIALEKEIIKYRSINNIYELFKDYSQEEVDLIIQRISPTERNLIYFRFGENLNVKTTNEGWSLEKSRTLYKCIIPKMRRLLQKNFPKVKTKERKKEEIDLKSLRLKMGKEDFLEMINILKSPSYVEMASILSFKDTIMLVLNLEFINGKVFAPSQIASIFNMTVQDVLKESNDILLKYKESVCGSLNEKTFFKRALKRPYRF